MALDPALRKRLRQYLVRLYGPRADNALAKLSAVLERHTRTAHPAGAWCQRDVVLITYGDQVRCDEKKPLACLHEFLIESGLTRVVNYVHLLPFFPYSSDDGFAVIDYRTVDPRLGTWDDVHRLARDVGLMFDLVLNHVSSQSAWFKAYLAGDPRHEHYFIEVDPHADLHRVVRPRSSPLLTQFKTSRGTRAVWTTFSADQVDLNYAHPDVLVEMVDVLLEYVRHGAKIIRLDAIAYLWKQIGTSCIHLPQTHTVVKLLRYVLDAVAPGTWLLSETNVPHAENISYFGDGDEAHLVYQFSLPPLLLDAVLSGDARPLKRWLSTLNESIPGTSFFNFTASHDGIGVRPLEGLVNKSRIDDLARRVRDLGGKVSMRQNDDGSQSPYELNITYFAALGGSDLTPEIHVRRFMATQLVMLSLRGIPGIYFHSLTATPNDLEGMRRTGHARSINRRKFRRDELQAILRAEGTPPKMVFDEYRRVLAVRIAQPAFHPEASQSEVRLDHPALLAFQRMSLDGKQKILVLANFAPQAESVELAPLGLAAKGLDLLSGASPTGGTFQLAPYQVAWLEIGT